MKFSIKTMMIIVALAAIVAWSWSFSWQLAMPVALVVIIGWLVIYEESGHSRK